MVVEIGSAYVSAAYSNAFPSTIEDENLTEGTAVDYESKHFRRGK
jgi:hypothetical protein